MPFGVSALRKVFAKLRRWLRWPLRIVAALLVIVLVCGFISTDHYRAFGGSPSSQTLARIYKSPRFNGQTFVNLESTSMMKEGSAWSSTKQWAFGDEMRAPTCSLPMSTDAAARLRTPPPSGLRVTWLGHSTTLLEIDGTNVLTDPIWSERASPSTWVGPTRFHPPPLAFADLPRIDAVVISHEHYDHLDMETVKRLAAKGAAFHVPLGIGAHLSTWGVPNNQIFEHDWWESTTLPSGLNIVSTPARHFNGRGVPFRVGALWTSWSLVGPQHRVFFSGDSGLTESFREIGTREGPFDVALIEIGQYHPSWGDIHLGPKGALDAFSMLNAKLLLPIHWATFQLGYHAWSEPAETVTTEAAARNIPITTPLLGEPIEPTNPAPTTAWWRVLPPIAPRCP